MNDPARAIHILFCSRLVREKGIDILLDLIPYTLKDPCFDGIHWHIASDGMYEMSVRELSLSSEGRVTYYGKLHQSDLALLMRKMDFLFMPSRFLETFGLTALESLASGVPVIGIKKGGLSEFIPDLYSIDEGNPIESSLALFRKIVEGEISKVPIQVDSFDLRHWGNRTLALFPRDSTLFLLHDYADRIGGAEVYMEFLMQYLPHLGYKVSRLSLEGKTTTCSRRIQFIVSIFAFHRFYTVLRKLERVKPNHIWMHSILRYFGYWGVRAIKAYAEKNREVTVSLSHHDIGCIAPFPQYITEEAQIPISMSLADFLRGLHGIRAFTAIFKWFYLRALLGVLPKNTHHIIFSPFLEKHMKHHFPGSRISILPHTYDDTLFHR